MWVRVSERLWLNLKRCKKVRVGWDSDGKVDWCEIEMNDGEVVCAEGEYAVGVARMLTVANMSLLVKEGGDVK